MFQTNSDRTLRSALLSHRDVFLGSGPSLGSIPSLIDYFIGLGGSQPVMNSFWM